MILVRDCHGFTKIDVLEKQFMQLIWKPFLMMIQLLVEQIHYKLDHLKLLLMLMMLMELIDLLICMYFVMPTLFIK